MIYAPAQCHADATFSLIWYLLNNELQGAVSLPTNKKVTVIFVLGEFFNTNIAWSCGILDTAPHSLAKYFVPVFNCED